MKALFLYLAFASLLNHCSALAQSPVPPLLPFQGRLADANGTAIADGARVVQFKIYDAPVGGQAVWNGEVQKLTVNAGMVNTFLGTKVDLSRVDFNRTLYLEITLDADGNNEITPADPPLLPRQTILPAVFAKEAADSRKLAGWDWGSLLNTNDPVNGRLSGDKLADGSLPASKIADGSLPGSKILDLSIAGGKLMPETVVALHIATAAVGTDKLTNEAVTREKIAPQSVTINHLVPRQIGTNVDAGGLAVSDGSGEDQTFTSRSFQDVQNFTVAIRTIGGPVLVFLTAEPGEPDSHIYVTRLGAADPSADIQLIRDGSVSVGNYNIGTGNSGTYVSIPPSAVSFVDLPPGGEHTYRVRVRIAGAEGVFRVRRARLIAYEL